jgi:biopolymer transport protein ExbB/TolQ
MRMGQKLTPASFAAAGLHSIIVHMTIWGLVMVGMVVIVVVVIVVMVVVVVVVWIIAAALRAVRDLHWQRNETNRAVRNCGSGRKLCCHSPWTQR